MSEPEKKVTIYNIEQIINDFLNDLCKSKNVDITDKSLYVREFVEREKLKVEDALNEIGTINLVGGQLHRSYEQFSRTNKRTGERFNRKDIVDCVVLKIQDYSEKYGGSYDVALNLNNNMSFRDSLCSLSRDELRSCIAFVEDKLVKLGHKKKITIKGDPQ